MFLSDGYRAYYKSTIKTSASVERGCYKARHTRLSDRLFPKWKLPLSLIISYYGKSAIIKTHFYRTTVDDINVTNIQRPFSSNNGNGNKKALLPAEHLLREV